MKSVNNCPVFNADLWSSLHLKELYFTPRAHPLSQTVKKHRWDRVQPAMCCIRHSLVRTRSSVHCVTHLRCWSTHDARVLTLRATKRPQRDKHMCGSWRQRGPKGPRSASGQRRADNESRRIWIARGPRGCPPGAAAQPQKQADPKQEVRRWREKVWQVRKCKD